jgi:type IV pilus assembly protein PilP
MNAPSSSPSSSVRAAFATLGFALLVAACGSKPTTTTTNDAPPPPQRRVPVAASASNSAAAPRLELTEGDFTPSDQSRDPFRGYAEIFAATAGKKNATQQKIVADRYSLDELKLVAVITGNTASRAMFVDPSGKGHVVTRGELVGRSESVRATAQKGIQSYEASWKVDRIREGDVVFIREDPERPNVAAATRVIALRPEGDPTPARRLSPYAGSACRLSCLLSDMSPRPRSTRGRALFVGVGVLLDAAVVFDFRRSRGENRLRELGRGPLLLLTMVVRVPHA